MNPKCDCGVKYVFYCTREKDDQLFHFWYCPKCGTPVHDITYRYHPTNCPKHHWEHIGTVLVDDKHCHQLYHVDRCDRCSATREIPRNTREAGFSGRIEIDDPRVQRDLLLNKSSWERVIPKELQELRTVDLPKYPVLPREVDL